MSASAKDTFEPQSFRAQSFKSGAWRGTSGSAEVAGPYCLQSVQAFVPGAIRNEVFNPGSLVNQNCCESGC